MAPQQAGSAALLLAPNCGHLQQRIVGAQQVVPGNGSITSTSSSMGSSGRSNVGEGWWNGKGGGAVHSDRARQEVLWRQFFLDPSMWWDNRLDKKGSRSPDFRHRQSGDVLWLNSFCKPAWVDEQLAAWDTALPAGLGGGREEWGAQAVSRLCEEGLLSEAVDALGVLVEKETRVPNSVMYGLIKRCVAEKDLAVGDRVRHLSAKLGYEENTFLANNIVRMCACLGRLEEASEVFRQVADPDAFTWSAIISAYAKHGEGREAIKLYQEMERSGVKPDGHVFVAALQACASAADLEAGRQVHAGVVGCGLEPNLFVCNGLVDMYAKCGRVEDARRVFDSAVSRDVVTWNAMIGGYAEQGLGREALVLYAGMGEEGRIVPDRVTFACLLKACACAGDSVQGQEVHEEVVRRGLEGDTVVGTALVDMYAKCGRVEDARRVLDKLPTRDVVAWTAMISGYAKCGMLEEARKFFDGLPSRNVVTWTALIAGYAEHGLGQEALALYEKMEREGLILANSLTFACLLKACATLGALQQGKHLHLQVLERGLGGDKVVGTCLVDMYAKCGRAEDARRVLDRLPSRDVVSWTAMINGFGQSNECHKAIQCFQEMVQEGVEANETTFTCLLVACSHEGLVSEGRHLWQSMVEEWGIEPTVEHYNCMVDMLGRAGHLDEAEVMLQARARAMASASAEGNDVGLMALLNACKCHGDIARGIRLFQKLVSMDSQDASAYVLMANMYADAGRWADVDRIERLRRCAGASKKAAVAGIEVDKRVHSFVVGEDKGDMLSKVKKMNVRLKQEGGHVPHTELVLKPLSQQEKEDELCGHAEKLALAYGLLNTPDGTPLLVTKNLRMCNDCHSSTEALSRIQRRDIVVRDAHRVHRFVDGSCHCGGRP